MAYDEVLANRLRELLAGEDAVTETKMFGGLAFLLHGNMSVSASRHGGILVRIDPADTDAALARPHASMMEMGGRTREGWITVAPEGLKTTRQLTAWVRQSVAYAKTLPPKRPRQAKS
jgi:TfoX/Sxy family transcriptional regulator of competence genes